MGGSLEDRYDRLRAAVLAGDAPAVNSVLKSGYIHPDAVLTATGHTMLTLAATRSSLDVIRTLLKYGADPNGNDEAERPLHAAAAAADAGAALLLLHNGADPNVRESTGDTPLSIAVSKNLPTTVSLLLRYGADPKTSRVEGRSLLDHSRRAGNVEVADLLERTLRGAPLSR